MITNRFLISGMLVLTCAAAGCGASDDNGGGADSTPVNDTGGTLNTDATLGCFELASGSCVMETFQNPQTLTPNADGVYELELVPSEFFVDGQRHCGRTYNGLFPAPTLETLPQQDGAPRQVRVNLRNRFTKSDFQKLSSGPCTCTDSAGSDCTPSGSSGHDMGHDADDCSCKTAEGHMCHYFDFNVTNLHAHGSHVRPDYASGGGCVETDDLKCRGCSEKADATPRTCFFADDVISRVTPGEGVQHRWDIDEDGPAHEGLHWYHPHIHGSTAIQVASGATGAWIVRGPTDEIPGIKDARERIFLIMTPPVTYDPLPDGQPCDEDHITFNDFATLGDTSKKQTNLINGIRQPRLITAPGQIERWRFLHGSFLDEMTIAVYKGKDSDCKNLDFEAGPIALTQIGRDGLTLPKPADGKDWPFAPPYLFLSPGYRIDTLLDGSQFQDGDTLCMMSGRFLQADPTGRTDRAVGLTTVPTVDEILQLTTNGDLIAIINVTQSAGEPTETQMPDLTEVAKHTPTMKLQGGTTDALAECEKALAVTDVGEIDQVSAMWMIFAQTEGLDQCGCPDHNLNCKNFEQTNRELYPYDRVFKVGDVEHWRLLAGFDGHPFHIHINPFLVCPLPPAGADHPNTKSRLFEPPFAHWRDTYLVNLNRTVDLLTEYRSFSGTYVYHCHKLNHEDHGMMELVKVCDPKVEDCDTLCAGGRCHWSTCVDGDTDCERAKAGTLCFLDPTLCPEAAVRCLPCNGEEMSCPPAAFCAEKPSPDGVFRCVPGCANDTDCLPIDACKDGECIAAPCPGPCGPGKTCVHGVCQ